ncbi:MAG TPA: rhomboid family intramembrane serine protease [Caulobacteraceae bacterium]|nr:rhomboid family intramembrane serine protease [Caulobacteraceae bacterium]
MDERQIDGPWRPGEAREPIIRAPWTIVVLCIGLVALYAVQSLTHLDVARSPLALSATGLEAGRWLPLITSLFLHGSWPHVLINAVAALAYGPPVARLLGTDVRGALVFSAFYLVCGVAGGLGYVALNPHDPTPLVGASGAISGLLGAASRLLEGRGRIGPMFGSTVIGMAIAWTIINVVLGVSGLTPGAGDMKVAWQAHVVGYAAGVLLIGVFARLAGATQAAFTH